MRVILLSREGYLNSMELDSKVEIIPQRLFDIIKPPDTMSRKACFHLCNKLLDGHFLYVEQP